MEDYDPTDNINTDIDIDTEDTTHHSSQDITYHTDFVANNNNSDIDTDDTIHETSQDITYNTDYERNNTYIGKIINNSSGIEFFNDKCSPNKTNKNEDTDYIYHIIDQIEDFFHYVKKIAYIWVIIGLIN